MVCVVLDDTNKTQVGASYRSHTWIYCQTLNFEAFVHQSETPDVNNPIYVN